jgi:predicted nucleic acid-binding protein
VVIVDTGAWLALANPRDRFHVRVRRALGTVREPLITTLPVLTEATHLLLARLGTDALLRFVNSWAAGAFRVFDFPAEQLPRVATLMKRYADLPMDLADASLVILAEALDDGRIISTDLRDFRAYRWKSRQPFRNLLDQER